MLKFDNNTQVTLLEGHKSLKIELENLRSGFSGMKNSMNTEIRSAVNEGSMSGEYAHALDSECTEIMNDISNFENRIEEAITKIDEKIKEIESGTVYVELTPEQFFSSPGTCPIISAENEIVSSVNEGRKKQTISVESATVIKTTKEVKAPYKDPVIIQKAYPANRIKITGYKDDSFVIALIDGENVVVR